MEVFWIQDLCHHQTSRLHMIMSHKVSFVWLTLTRESLKVELSSKTKLGQAGIKILRSRYNAVLVSVFVLIQFLLLQLRKTWTWLTTGQLERSGRSGYTSYMKKHRLFSFSLHRSLSHSPFLALFALPLFPFLSLHWDVYLILLYVILLLLFLISFSSPLSFFHSFLPNLIHFSIAPLIASPHNLYLSISFSLFLFLTLLVYLYLSLFERLSWEFLHNAYSHSSCHHPFSFLLLVSQNESKNRGIVCDRECLQLVKFGADAIKTTKTCEEENRTGSSSIEASTRVSELH